VRRKDDREAARPDGREGGAAGKSPMALGSAREVFFLASHSLRPPVSPFSSFRRAVGEMVKTIGGFRRLHEMLAVIKEIGGLKKFKDLLDAIAVSGAGEPTP
jgi:hypothetical protein